VQVTAILSVGVVVVGAVARAQDGDAHAPILYLKHPVMQEGGRVGQIHTFVGAGARTWDGSPVRSSSNTRRTSTKSMSTITHPMLAVDVLVRCCASLSFWVLYFFCCCTHFGITRGFLLGLFFSHSSTHEDFSSPLLNS